MGPSWGFFVSTLADYVTAACSMIYSGMFDTFPNLRFCLGEGGATWLMWLWDRLALTYDVGRELPEAHEAPPDRVFALEHLRDRGPEPSSLWHISASASRP
jgi:predicted TIM-barrel fold metal-dependent hydrolase